MKCSSAAIGSLLVGLLLVGIFSPLAAQPPAGGLQGMLQAGKLRELTGEAIKPTEFNGRPVLMIFWESYCPSCRAEAPVLNRLLDKYQQKGLQIVGVSTVTSPKEAQLFAREQKVKYRLVTGSIKLAQRAEVIFLPTLLLFDQQGKLVKRFIGFQDEKTLALAIEPRLSPVAGGRK